jgi:hypothetical protein
MTLRTTLLNVCLVIFAISPTACTASRFSAVSSSSSATRSDSPAIVYASPARAVKLDDQLAAAAAVAAFFRSCAQQTGPVGKGGCPQRTNASNFCYPFTTTCEFDKPFTWKLVGEPSSRLSYGFDSSGQLQAAGHYVMVAGYSCLGIAGTCHDVSAGLFTATLQPSGASLSIANVESGNGVYVPPLPDPGDHAAILRAVKAFFMACANAPTSEGAPDCPQSINGGCISSPNQKPPTIWTLKGDPTARATVAWNSVVGIYTVTGTEDFHAATTEPCNGSLVNRDYGGLYWATVVWGDGGPQVITIGGLNNSGCPFC